MERERERDSVKVGYNKITCLQSVSVKINVLRNFLEESKFLLRHLLDILNLRGGYHVTHTLRKTSRMRIGVHTSYDTGNNVR